MVLWTWKCHLTIIQSKPLSVLLRAFVLFPPDFSVSKTARETLITQRPAKSMATFPLNLANWIIMLGVEESSLGSVLQCYHRQPLHQGYIRQIGGVGRRQHVKWVNSWRSQPADIGLRPLLWCLQWFQRSYLCVEEEDCRMQRTSAWHCDGPRWHLVTLLLAQVLGDSKASSNTVSLGIKILLSDPE